MTPLWQLADVEATWCAARIDGDGPRLGHRERDEVTPASVMKIQIGIAVARR